MPAEGVARKRVAAGHGTRSVDPQACALALLQELGADPGQLAGIEPLGPVSDELVRLRLGRIAALVDIVLVE